MEADRSAATPSGLAALVVLLRFHGVAADIEQLRRRFGDDITPREVLRCAKEFGLKAWICRANWRRLMTAPLPGIVVLSDGLCLLFVKATKDQVLVQNPLRDFAGHPSL